MSNLKQFNQLFDREERAIATITGQKSGGVVIGQTLGGAVVKLEGTMANGKQCYYDRRSSKILGEAPNVSFTEFGV